MNTQPQRLFNRQYVLFSLINLFVSVSFSMVSTLMSRYVHGIGMTVAIAGAITGAFSIASMVVRPVSGYINDHFDRKKLLALSTGAMALCTLGYGFTQNGAALLALRVLHGAAFAISSTVNMAVIPGIVPEKRVAEAISYFGVTQSLAIAAGPSIGLALAAVGGYALNFSVAAGIAALGAALATTLRFLSSGGGKPRGRLKLRLGDVFAKECLIYTVVDVAIASASGLENSFIALYGAAAGIANIGWYFTISAVTLCVARVAFGKLADRKGTSFALYPGLFLMTLGFLLMWRSDAPWAFAVAAVIKTVGVALARPAIQAAAVKAVPPERRGAASSTYYIGSDIGQGTAPVIGGRVIDVTGGDYGAAFALYSVPLALSGVIYALYNRRRGGKERGA